MADGVSHDPIAITGQPKPQQSKAKPSEITIRPHTSASSAQRGSTANDGISITVSNEPFSPGTTTPNPFGIKHTGSFDIDTYFTGPRDMSRHSKWPLFLQMHGSILPKMIVPLLWIGGWATAITLISKLVFDLGVQSVLLTITGFVVGLGLSFRSSTAYERYAEGRKYWASLAQAAQALGRVFWIHAKHPDGRDPREVMLRKVTAVNLLLAFAVALKHKLRFEPYTAYDDLQDLVGHLPSFARAATEAEPGRAVPPRTRWYKEVGEYLGLPFAASNPRKVLKKSSRPLGNLPLEILSHLAVTVDGMIGDGQLPIPMTQTLAYNNLSQLNDVLTGTERVLNTPLPIAYAIAISQITWVYVLLLPFQLYPVLDWVTIPATIAASYIILGILMIGREIENPFGQDVNDLPLESFCDQIAVELDTIMSHDMREPDAYIESDRNKPLYPVSQAGYLTWVRRPEDKVREAIRKKMANVFNSRITQKQGTEKQGLEEMV